MDPTYNHDQPGNIEVGRKFERDFGKSFVKEEQVSSNAGMQIQNFDDTHPPQKPKRARKQKDSHSNTNGGYGSLPKRGTFEETNYQELLQRSREMFEKRHHILAKLSSNGIYDDLKEDDVDLLALMQDTLNQPDEMFKETPKAVLQTCKDTSVIQSLIQEKVSCVHLTNRFMRLLNTRKQKPRLMTITSELQTL